MTIPLPGTSVLGGNLHVPSEPSVSPNSTLEQNLFILTLIQQSDSLSQPPAHS